MDRTRFLTKLCINNEKDVCRNDTKLITFVDFMNEPRDRLSET